MKPNLFLTLACLLLLTGFALAQPATPEMDVMKGLYRSLWNNQTANFTVMELLDNADIRKAWEISDEQMQQYEDRKNDKLNDLVQRLVKMGVVEKKVVAVTKNENGEGVVFAALATPIEEMTVLEFTLGENENAENFGSLVMDAVSDAIEGVLTPQQWQNIRESQLANMDEMSLITPDMFEALDLTDAQRQEMAKIKKELEPEFEAVLDDFINGIIALQDESEDAPKRKQKQEEVMSKGKEFSTNFKMQMFDVLSDEQWKRLQHLIANPPEHAKIFRAKLREQNGESEAVASEKPEMEVWQPGPNSWKPGDAIPEKYRIERNERGKFPRVEEK